MSDTQTLDTLTAQLKNTFAKDSMHYTPDRYAKLAKNIISAIDIQREKLITM